jgi:hypothetical protein
MPPLPIAGAETTRFQIELGRDWAIDADERIETCHAADHLPSLTVV